MCPMPERQFSTDSGANCHRADLGLGAANTSAGRGEQPVRVLIADDNPIYRYGLRALLEAESDIRVVGEASNVAEAVKLVFELMPDVLLLDLATQQVSGIEVLRQTASLSQQVRTIVLAVATARPQIVQALQLGARGVVLKDASTEVFVKSIRAVMNGEYWVARENMSDLIRILRTSASNAKAEQRNRRLTTRELEVVSAVVGGYTNSDIAKKFCVREDTIKHHLTNIFDKLGASNRLELAILAIGRGLVPKP
jgi:two-component system, NarL family, nitrate/nitrite response regulator NarL